MSTLIEKEEIIPDNQKTIFDWCREGDLDKIKDCLKHNDIDQIDEQVRVYYLSLYISLIGKSIPFIVIDNPLTIRIPSL